MKEPALARDNGDNAEPVASFIAIPVASPIVSVILNVVAEGTHEELLKEKGIYKKLWDREKAVEILDSEQ